MVPRLRGGESILDLQPALGADAQQDPAARHILGGEFWWAVVAFGEFGLDDVDAGAHIARGVIFGKPLDKRVVFLGERFLAREVLFGESVFNRAQPAQAMPVIVGMLQRRFDPLPALGKDAIALCGELFAHQAHEEIGVL